VAKPHTPQQIVDYLRLQIGQGASSCSPEEIAGHVPASRATINRYLLKLVAGGELLKLGSGPTTRYPLPTSLVVPTALTASEQDRQQYRFSLAGQALIKALRAPIGTRDPVTYQRRLVDNYIPNQSSLLPVSLAADLFAKGKATGQQPAGTYARKVLEQLLIDLAWHSSRLEGNRMTLLDTKALFAKGRANGDDMDATMLLNHKDAIEFIVDAVPEYGITEAVVRNIQSLLMQGLLINSESLGAIRRTIVNISDSVYVPAQAPQLLEEMLRLIVDKARSIKNPVEAAFFLWLNIAYLQPFEDGNKRTSRLCANLPLLLQNCAPLSFLDVEAPDYALSVIAVYEKQDVSLAVELFEWTYLRSIQKYEVILQSMGPTNPFRSLYREQLGASLRQVVSDRLTVNAALANLAVPAEDQAAFLALLREELLHLEDYNCARYRLSIRLTEEWIKAGRPGL
jgi:Fic family protein